MSVLSQLKNSSRGRKSIKRVGRGPGSGVGKTCGRGTKGQGARSGYKRRYGQEGGQVPLYRKVPTRGFTRGRFFREVSKINLRQIEDLFEAGDTVNVETLRARGFLGGRVHALKILGDGELLKKVTIEANAFSAGAKRKLDAAGISYKQVA